MNGGVDGMIGRTGIGARKLVRPAGRAAALMMVVALSGCVSIFPKTKPIQLYEFGQIQPPQTAPTTPGAVGVALGQINMPPAAVTDQILAVTGQKAAYIAGVRWVVPAGLMIQGDADRAFEARSRRVRLLHRGEIGSASALLRLDVGDFEARYDTPEAAPTVVVSLRANLTLPSGAAIASHTFTAREPATDNRIAPIAAAYDKAVIEVLDQVVDWTDANAPAGPAASPVATTTQTTSTSTSVSTISGPR